MERKYEFTGETMEWDGHTLHRIRAVRSFDREEAAPEDDDDWFYEHMLGTIEAGELGGWIEKEENLSHDDSC